MKEFNLPNIDNEKSVLKTIRIKLTTLKKIEELSKGSNISRETFKLFLILQVDVVAIILHHFIYIGFCMVGVQIR